MLQDWNDPTRTITPTTATLAPAAAASVVMPAANPGLQPATAAARPVASVPLPPGQRQGFVDETATAGGFSAKPRRDDGVASNDPG